MKRLKLVMAFVMLALGISAYGQVTEAPEWKAEIRDKSFDAGDTITVKFTAKIPDKWYLYSSDFNPDLGPTVTEFQFDENPEFKVIDSVVPVGAKRKYDEIFEGEYTYFTKEAVFKQKIEIQGKDPVINAVVSYQICSDENGQCIPFTSEIPVTGIKQNSTGEKNEELEVREMQAFQNNFRSGNEQKEGVSFLISFFLVSFGAGLAAILTPCVFPMIPMTVSYFTKSGSNRKKGIFQALLYGISIIVIYTMVGTLFSVLFGAAFANFLSTHWIPNLLFFAVFVLFALSFFGLFEIRLPNSLINKMDKQSNKGGLIGIFFMAFTLVLVGFSCTGPIVGTILLQAAGGEMLKPLVGMLGFSLAFALPFTLFAIFPNWLRSLPKSGGWLNTVKVTLGFLELALALKFLSIVDQVYHWDFLSRDLFLILWIVIFSFLGLYLLGKITFPHEEKRSSISIGRMISALLVFSFVIYLIPGLLGAPLKGLAGYLPPMSSQEFNISKLTASSSISRNEKENIAECGVPKYDNLLEIPHGIHGYLDYEQALKCAKKKNKPLFIDFTGHGCVNCREMEARVWSDPKVLKRLKEDYVVVALYVDEKKELPESEWYVSPNDNWIKKTIGAQNLDFMIQKLNANAQPYYTLVDNDGSLLSAPKAYDLNVDRFVDFLDNGLKRYKSQNDQGISL
ncbi:protein-disulfide reductase DsbD family protein [Christiangramia crocea]|uniref:LptF/LptG family permease n=1 Tax=Christiangramia crocea TaxID=2904124 RepID=A0A9X2A7R5_9FLAO|nr:thioredoxin family protein [Gramella crocea]MCG9972166.1 LptF/LptG family permease [Gramella crocea]